MFSPLTPLNGETTAIPIELQAAPDSDLPEGHFAGRWQIRIEGPCVHQTLDAGPASGPPPRLHLLGEIRDGHRVRALAMAIFLAWLLHILRCAARTHRFSEGLRVLHGVEPTDLHLDRRL